MALVVLLCACGHSYEAITGSTIRDADAERCPKCQGSQLETQVPATLGIGKRRLTADDLTPEEIACYRENQAHLEANADKLLSGEWADRHPSTAPREFSAQVPEHMRKRYF